MPEASPERSRICIAILALGGEGGGMLADWIEHVAREAGWLAQGTSVPGVAQRTGSTVYYIELVRAQPGRRPVMAQMPVPGDVDIVIASELMEAGRAMLRNFVTADRTTLIASTHRIYAISEKSAMGDGRARGEHIVDAAHKRARDFIGFDMAAAAERSDSMISAVMLGALAGSEALPFERRAFEQAIFHGGIAVRANLGGFEEGFRASRRATSLPQAAEPPPPAPTSLHGRRLLNRAMGSLPGRAHVNAARGLERLFDYQGFHYAERYLERLERIAAADAAPFDLTAEVARHLALWMSYEDIIRVADLKTRADRLARVRDEVKAGSGTLLRVTEFMHPRLQEVCDILPAGLGCAIRRSPIVSAALAPLFRKGREVTTTGVAWFTALWVLARLRPLRPRSLRFKEEQSRIELWLDNVATLAAQDKAAAIELARCQTLIKGYGDTLERGLRSFEAICEAFSSLPATRRTAPWLSQARASALADESGESLARHLAA